MFGLFFLVCTAGTCEPFVHEDLFFNKENCEVVGTTITQDIQEKRPNILIVTYVCYDWGRGV